MGILGGRKMKNKKYELNLFSFYDYAGMEEHFEEMALKGWMIETKKFVFNIYREIEPKKIKFNVSYAQKVIDEYNPKMDDELGEFRDLVEYSGWIFALESGGMDVLYSEDINIAPVETDPHLRIDSVHKHMKKSLAMYYFFVVFMIFLNYTFFINGILKNPISFASDFLKINEFILKILIIIYGIINIVDYSNWKKKALVRADLGEFALKNGNSRSVIVYSLYIVFFIELIFYLLQATYFGFTFLIIKEIVGFVFLFTAIVLGDYFKERMKRKGIDRDKIKIRTIMLVVAILFLDNIIFSFFVEDSPKLESMPYTVQELCGKNANDICHIESRDSFFSSQRVLGQSNEEGEPELWFYYDEVTVHMPFLYEPYKNYILEKSEDYKLVGDTSWGANKVYYNSKNGRKFYILFYDNKILKMNFSWDVTDEQKAKIRQKTMG